MFLRHTSLERLAAGAAIARKLFIFRFSEANFQKHLDLCHHFLLDDLDSFAALLKSKGTLLTQVAHVVNANEAKKDSTSAGAGAGAGSTSIALS